MENKQNKDNGNQDSFDKLWNTLKSMRFAIILLLVITLASIFNLFANEFIVQANGTAENARMIFNRTYGEPRATLLTLFQMYAPYRSWWYTSMLGLLTLSLLICVIDRTPIVWKKATKPHFVQDIDNYDKMKPNSLLMGSKQTFDDLIQMLKSAGYRIRLSETDNVKHVHAARNLFSEFGPLIIHVGFILLIIGGAMIARGELRMHVQGLPGDLLAPDESLWGFNVRVDDFQVEYNPLRKNQIIRIDNDSRIGKIIKENGDGTFDIEQYRPKEDYLSRVKAERLSNRIDTRMGRGRIDQGNISDYIATLTVIEDGMEIMTQRVEVNHPLRHRGYRFYQSSFNDQLVDLQGRWTTILEVRRDKGSVFVWAGILIVTLGLIMGLYFTPREIFAKCTLTEKQATIHLAGRTTRNHSLLVRHFDELLSRLQDSDKAKST